MRHAWIDVEWFINVRSFEHKRWF